MEENKTIKKKRVYSLAETVFAWACIGFGYIMSRVTEFTSPLTAFILVIALYAAAVIMLRVNKLHISPMGAIVGASGLIISLSIIIDGTFLTGLSFIYALAAGAYFVFSSSGNTLESGVSDLMLRDVLRAVLSYPFASFTNIFPALTGRLGKKTVKTSLHIVLGALAATIPACIIVKLLSYDDGFTGILKSVFSFERFNVGSFIYFGIITVLAAMYIFGLYVSSVDRKGMGKLSAESVKEKTAARKRVPAAAVLAFAAPMLAVYVVFFISQWKYFVSGFSGILPDGTTYAEYARNGFFQLCAVAAINLVLTAMIDAFAERAGKAKDVSARVVSAVLAISSLVLLSTAAAKMALYVKMYGLTQTRVYASWFMAVLAVVFVLVIVKQLVPRFKLIPISLACCVALYAVLAFSGVEGLIAKHNVDRYLDKTLYNVDVVELYNLGDAAVPEIARLADELGVGADDGIKYDYQTMYSESTPIKDRIACTLMLACDRYPEAYRGMTPWTIQRRRAINALKAYGWMD